MAPRAGMAGPGLAAQRVLTRIAYLDGHFSQWRSAGFREEV
jgi:hypothetical protein